MVVIVILLDFFLFIFLFFFFLLFSLFFLYSSFHFIIWNTNGYGIDYKIEFNPFQIAITLININLYFFLDE